MEETKPTKKGPKNIDLRHADLVFLLCYFVSGILDSSSYNAWTCFVSMQTGNTVFLGLGASGQPHGKPYGWLKSLASIASFIVGSFIFSFLMRGRTKQRLALSLSFAVQALCIIVSAILVQTRVVASHSESGEGKTDRAFILKPLIPLILLALQAGGQMAASRGCGFNELPTTVLTSVYYDIASDPALTAGVAKNVKRNRRIGAGVFFLAGAIVGGWMYKGTNGSMAPGLWLAAGLKALGAVAWLFWRVEES
ncbi:hypothetical protein NLU13_7849 [Sarocladium strictum]|uniref:DUF1275 domain protein n=1 Tax=Sarocladium strictum TaxID=5046 RepID=A0AA39GDJ9_SARSR|nr:hypothetical protein NLU13_7849 [Sarocladium strictum]